MTEVARSCKVDSLDFSNLLKMTKTTIEVDNVFRYVRSKIENEAISQNIVLDHANMQLLKAFALVFKTSGAF